MLSSGTIKTASGCCYLALTAALAYRESQSEWDQRQNGTNFQDPPKHTNPLEATTFAQQLREDMPFTPYHVSAYVLLRSMATMIMTCLSLPLPPPLPPCPFLVVLQRLYSSPPSLNKKISWVVGQARHHFGASPQRWPRRVSFAHTS